MDKIYWNGSDGVYRNAGDLGPFEATDAELEECCCEEECPDNCDACPATYTVVISGFTCPVNPNGTFNLTRSGCVWSGGGVTLSCSAGLGWYVNFSTHPSLTCNATSGSYAACPPTGVYPTPGGCPACSVNGTVTVSTP